MDPIVLRIAVEMFFEDDEEEEKLPVAKVTNYAEEVVPQFSDQQFQYHFRMRPQTFENLLVKQYGLPTAVRRLSGNQEISLEKQLLIALWYLANLESFRSVADRFGVSKSTAWLCLYKICLMLLEVNVGHHIISFSNEEKCLETMNEVRRKTKFPGVIGAVDGSHIPIIAPREEPASYVNRKNFHSVILQATCNHKKEFIHCTAGEAGSVHDACVFRRSELPIILERIHIPQDGHLLGDSAYPSSTKVLVPYKDNGHLTAIQINYNKKHAKARAMIEIAFALLKGRFRRLKLCEAKRIEFIPLIIMASCILHNICLRTNDIPNDINLEAERNEERIMHMNNDFGVEEAGAHLAKREEIANTMYLELLRQERR